MNNIEKKFYNLLEKIELNKSEFDAKWIAHELAEIAEQEVIIDYDYCNKWMEGKYNKLVDEFTALQKQLSEIRYLDRVKVEKTIDEFIKNTSGCSNSLMEDIEDLNRYEEEAITAICNLAIKPLTSDRVIEVLNKWNVVSNAPESILTKYWDCEDDITNEDKLDKIASEILGEEIE